MSTKVDDTLHLKNFIDLIDKSENAKQKEVKINLAQAKKVRNSLTTLLLHYVEIQSRKQDQGGESQISMDGGDFK
jgi:hypothetical protein|tara:strand:+ start:296 stop:520 length:225 start_codon:yes stop_codon:yes gene_type:complete